MAAPLLSTVVKTSGTLGKAAMIVADIVAR
jgi:hypothetical protein